MLHKDENKGKNYKIMRKLNFEAYLPEKVCLKMDLLMTMAPNFWPENLFVAVAEWSRASELRSFGRNLE